MDSPSSLSDIGLIGLAVMGKSLVLNLASRGISVSGYTRNPAHVREFAGDPRVKGKKIALQDSLEAFLATLKKPRRIWLMVKAGPPVDEMITALLPVLDKGDLICEGGNSHYTDTERRQKLCADKGVLYLGCGVSGGEEGALKGPSLMVGGDKQAFQLMETSLRAIAATTQDGPCVGLLGPGGAGHFTKMVHNGIEYACMQSLAESYALLTQGLGYSLKEAAQIYDRWNQGELRSYLMEITAVILRKTDPDTGKPLLNLIQDEGEQKGTGKWVCQAALDLGIPAPTISAAVEARSLSAFKSERARLATALKNPGRKPKGPRASLAKGLQDIFYISQLAAFCQGLHLLSRASSAFSYRLDLAEVLRVWKGGCIIRAAMLDPLRKLFFKQMDLGNPLFNTAFAKALAPRLASAFKASLALKASGLAMPCLDASLNYVLGLSTARLPANLIQAQRDYFGAHTYQRVDKEGVFHTQW